MDTFKTYIRQIDSILRTEKMIWQCIWNYYSRSVKCFNFFFVNELLGIYLTTEQVLSSLSFIRLWFDGIFNKLVRCLKNIALALHLYCQRTQWLQGLWNRHLRFSTSILVDLHKPRHHRACISTSTIWNLAVPVESFLLSFLVTPDFGNRFWKQI